MSPVTTQRKIYTKQTFFFCFFFLFFHRFKRFGCILRMLYLYETNKHFKKNIFHTLKPALYLFPYLNNLLTLKKLTLLTKKKTKGGRGFILHITLFISILFFFLFYSLICVFFFNFNSILQHYIYWRLCFIMFFNSLFIRLSHIHDPGCRYDVLTLLTWFFSSFSNKLFFNQFYHLTLG